MSFAAANLLGWLPGRRTKPTPAPSQSFSTTWRLSHKLGNVFALTNVASQAASDVDVTTKSADADVKLRGEPWRTVAPGEACEFVAIADPTTPCLIFIEWTAADGTPHAAEAMIEPVPMIR